MKYFKVLELAYLNGALRQPGEIVDLPDSTTQVGACLMPCDKDGNELRPAVAKAKRGKADSTANLAADLG